MARLWENTERLLLRIWIAVLIALSAAAGAGAQTWQRLGPEGGMVMSLAAAIGERTVDKTEQTQPRTPKSNTNCSISVHYRR
ncbi:MAG: hypothetical protein WAN12_16830 [Candidatus Acidiferrum sp.]